MVCKGVPAIVLHCHTPPSGDVASMLRHIHPVSWDDCWTVNDPSSYPPSAIPGCYHNGLRALVRE
eukprot:5575633-Lingulodinium_polyedra.AAC.1